MPKEKTIKSIAARRQLSFLSTFEKKFQGFRREMERLQRSSSTGHAFGGSWPTDGLDRTARSLVGAGAVYGLPDITDWARNFLDKINSIHLSDTPPGENDMEWLAEQIGVLLDLHKAAEVRATELLGEDSISPPPHETRQEEPGGARESRPFIAPSTTTDPPPPLRETQPLREQQPMYAATVPVRQTAPTSYSPLVSAPSGIAVKRVSEAPRPIVSGETIPSSVIVALDDDALAQTIDDALSKAGFVLTRCSDLPNIGKMATEISPELIIVDMDDSTPGGMTVVNTLLTDPLTDYIPILRIATISGTFGGSVVPKPVDEERLVAAARRLGTPDAHMARILIGLRDPNLEELIGFVNDELRAGVIDSATGRHGTDRFRLLAEGPLMASVWGLIAQIRKAAAHGSRGKIRFMPATSGQMGMMALTEAEEVLETSGLTYPDEADLADLRGLKALVADDDPEIRAVFDKVLTDAGVQVRTVRDGIEALEVIRENPPDFVFSDILMPKMDGWELCNRLRGDYSLRHLPVILLSWKEDFLEQLRGLKVAADEFMLKEVDKQQILGRAARVMRPRFVLQRQLGIDGDVTGRIEKIGALAIINTAIGQRPDCRITFRETWNYFEADIRDAEIVAVTRTGTDGTFASGPAALERLLGVTSGRFAIVQGIDTPRRQFKEGTRNALKSACLKLNTMAAQITDGALLDIAGVQVDEDVINLYTPIMPPKLKKPLSKLIGGDSPRKIILAKDASPDAIETLLLDLVRVGGIIDIDAPAANLSRTPMTRDSASWRAVEDGKLIDDAGKTVASPRRSSLPPYRSTLPPTSAARPRGRVSGGWRALTIIALVALALSIYFNVRFWKETAEEEAGMGATKEHTDIEIPQPVVQQREQRPVEPETQPDEKAGFQQLPLPLAGEGRDGVNDAVKDEAGDLAEPDDKRFWKEKMRRLQEEGTAEEPEEKPSEKPAPLKSSSGALSIALPPYVTSKVKVLIDGKPRGTAPLKVTLPVGIHELTFISDGKRSLRMVSIKEGRTKNIEATVPK